MRMKNIYSYLRALLMLLFLTSGVGTMWGYVVTFKTADSDGSATNTTVSDYVSTGAEFIASMTNGGQAYYKGKYGLKLGSSKAAGSVEFTLSTSGSSIGQINATNLSVVSAVYDSGKTYKCTVTYTDNSTTTATVTFGAENNMSLNASKTIKKIKFESITTKSGRGYISSFTVTPAVDLVAVTDVTVNPTSTTLAVGEKQVLTATVLPENATNKGITWTSSDNNIATVANGVVTGIAVGTATITATTVDGGKTATCEVTVGGPVFTIDVSGGNTTPGFETGSTNNYPTNQTITLDGKGFYYSGVYYNDNKYLMFIKNTGYLYNTTSLGKIRSITVYYTGGTSEAVCAIQTGSSALSTRITAAGEGITSETVSQNGHTLHTAGNNEGYFQISNIDDSKNIQIEKIVITLGETSTEPTVYYTISLGDLTSDCSSTENPKSVASGSTNNTFIVTPDAGYDLETSDFIVEMGGDELTAGTDYTYDKANCTLIISTAITGNVVVDAMATRLVTISLDAASENCTAESIQVRSGSSDVQFPINVATGYVLDAESIELSPSKTFVWDTTTGILTITGTVDDDISVLALAEAIPLTEYTITFVDKGETCGTATVVDGAEITFPADRTGVNGWTFVGWSIKTSDIIPADIYTNDNKPTASGNVVYHAIYQKTEETGTAGWQLVTSETDLVVGDTYTIGSASTPQSEYVMGGQNDNNIEAVLWTQELAESKILKFVLGGSRNKWTMKVVDGEYLYAPNAKNNTTSNYLKQQSELTENGKWTINPSEGATEIKVTGGTNRYILRYNGLSTSNLFSCYKSGQSDVYLFRYFAGSTTTYSTDCPAGVSLVSISVNIDNTKTEYFEGEMLDLTNVVVTATYSDDTTVDVTERATFSPAAGSVLNTVGTQTITVTYGEMTTSFDVTVNARQYCNITWNVNGTVTTERQEQGAHLAMPVNPTLEDVVFMGWIVDGETFAADGSDFEEKKLDANATVPTLETITYLAVFATPEDSEETSTITLTKDNVHSGYTTDGVDRDMKNITGFKYYGCATAQRSGSSEYTLIQMRKPSGSAPEFTTTSWIYNTLELNIKQIVIQYDDQNENVATLRFGNMQNPMTEPTTPVIDGYRYTYNNVGRHPYFRISNDETGAVQIESIDIVCNVSTTYSDYRTKVMLNPHLSFDAPTYILRDGDNWVMPVATSKNTDVVITYTSENSSVAEIVDNEITFKGYGTTTITATQAENDTYAAAQATCMLKFVPASVSVTTNGYGWATYAPSYDIMVDNMQVSQGIAKVFYVTQLKQENDKDVVATNDAVEALGADKAMATATGVLIWTREPNTTITFTCSTITDKDHISELPGNMLVGVTEETDLDGRENAYIFTQKNGNIGFYKWTSGKLAANKCYLQLPEGSNAASLSIMLPNGDETAIGSVFGGEGNAPMYNLDGRRVNSNYRGIVIINGKKVVNK